MYYFKNQDWSNLSKDLSDITNIQNLKSEFWSILHAAYPQIDQKKTVIIALITTCVSEISKYFALFIVLIVVGFVVSYFVTRWLIRRDVSHRKWWKAILFAIVDAAICVLAVYLIVLSYEKLDNGFIWVLALILIGLSLFLLLGNLILIVAGLLLIFLVPFANMIVLTLVLGLAILEVTQVVVTTNAEGYVRFMAGEEFIKQKDKNSKKLEKENADLKKNAE